jgi:hypothetical protein
MGMASEVVERTERRARFPYVDGKMKEVKCSNCVEQLDVSGK